MVGFKKTKMSLCHLTQYCAVLQQKTIWVWTLTHLYPCLNYFPTPTLTQTPGLKKQEAQIWLYYESQNNCASRLGSQIIWPSEEMCTLASANSPAIGHTFCRVSDSRDASQAAVLGAESHRFVSTARGMFISILCWCTRDLLCFCALKMYSSNIRIT